MKSMPVRVVVLSVLLWSSASSLRAQRLVRETTAQWRAAKSLPLTPVRRWCSELDAPGCDFKRPASVRATPDGGILASDAAGPLHRFASDGRFIGPLGRKGKGPGEYGFVIDAHVASSGLVTWFDNTQMRIATVRLDGTAGPVTRVMPPHTMLNLFLVDTQLVILDVPVGAKAGDTVAGTYRTVPSSGAPTVLATVRTPAIFTLGSEGFIPMRSPFRPSAVGHVGASGDVAHSNGGRYEVEVFPRGAAAWRLRIDVPLRPVTTADQDSAIARVLKIFKATSLSALPPAAREPFANMGTTFPPLADIRVLRDGTVWIRPVAEAGVAQARWDVFARDGKRIGYVVLPLGARVWDGARDWVLVDELGVDDVANFVRYRVGP